MVIPPAAAFVLGDTDANAHERVHRHAVRHSRETCRTTTPTSRSLGTNP
jgi:hypothetical protein